MQWRTAEAVALECRDAIRSLRRSARFAITAIVTVTLGLAGTVTIFSVLNPLLFRSLPYPEAERLVWLFRTEPRSDRLPQSAGRYLDYRDRSSVFEQLAAVQWVNFNLAEPGLPADRVQGLRVSGNFFSTVGVPPQLGRTVMPDDDRPGHDAVIVLSHRFWTTRFNADPAVVGRQVRLNDVPTTVIGVMPESFDYPLFWQGVDLWRPFAFTAEQRADRRNNFIRGFGRLERDVSPAAADASLKALAQQLLREQAGSNPQEGVRVEPLSLVSPESRRVSMVTLLLSGLVLLIACVNLANLQLLRTVERAREFAVRGALGAARSRLLRLSLTESMMIAAIGGALALPVAYGCTRLIVAWRYSQLPGVDVTVDLASFLYALACAALTGMAFGAVPAWLVWRSNLNDVLRHSRTSTGGASHHRFRHSLVVAEVAFAVIVLTAGVSFVRGLQRIVAADPGWRTEGLVNAFVNLPGVDYAAPQRRFAVYERLREEASAIPGVSHVAIAASGLPIQGFNMTSSVVHENGTAPVMAFNERITPAYFDVMGMRLREGRRFTDADRFGSVPVVIINEAMARRLWPNESAVGKHIAFGPAPELVWRQIVGVVNDVAFPWVGPRDTELQTYHPLAQGVPVSASILLRMDGSPEGIAPQLRRIMTGLDPNLPIYSIRTADSLRQSSTAELRVLSSVLGAFGFVSLGLAAVGIFGVVSYIGRQRAGEIALRVALGARRREVIWLVLRQGLTVVAIGSTIGLLGGVGVARALAAAMPRLPVVEGAVLIGATVVIVAVALTACYLPARRASTTPPMLALRHD